MSNINRIRVKLHEYNIEAMLVTGHTSRLFATGFSSSAGVLLVTADNAWFVIDSRYYEVAQDAITDAKVVALKKSEKYEDGIETLIRDNGIGVLGFEDGTASYANYQAWVKKFGIELVPAQKLISALREVKSRSEADNMIKAQRLSEKIFEELLPIISTDMTEKELAAEFVYRAYKNSADKEGFDPIIVSGPNSSRPHGVPGDTKIGKGFLTCDFGVKLNGWISDTTRTLCIGKPDDEMVKVYETVLNAQEAGIAAVHGGVKGVDVDAAARKVVVDAGYGDYFGHGFGHSIGLDVHETLSASPTSEDILPIGAMISAEPGIYLPGRFGVRIEDVLYVTEEGCENITSLPKSLIVL